jgi:hypothetical protein
MNDNARMMNIRLYSFQQSAVGCRVFRDNARWSSLRHPVQFVVSTASPHAG